MTPARRAPSGLSLIELVVAMALLALVAVMGVQSLSGALRQRGDLDARAGAGTDLIEATALLRNDLAAAAPLRFFPPSGNAQPAIAALPGGGFALSRASTAAGPLGLARVEWQLEDGRLSRVLWPGLTPTTEAEANPAMPVLEGVEAIGLRSYWTGAGWIDGPRLAELDRTLALGQTNDGPPRQQYSDLMPRAIEIILTTRDHGDLRLLEYLQ